ncbi:MAG: DUF2851 family protein [Bacteroidales bacterium]|nr:DUF2851 family protein [Bacteroidales bacterium]
MKEDFLHYLWKHKTYNAIGLQTTTGDSLRIISPGLAHQDAGPDFKQATVKINEITWVGDVEIHIRSSDWFRHGHEHDEKYRSVILHVVYQNDMTVLRDNQEPYPTLELKRYVPEELLACYQTLSLSKQTLPCALSLPQIPKIQLVTWLSSVGIERLQRREKAIFELLRSCREDWNETLFRWLAISFGFKTNASAFEQLSKSLPLKYLQKHTTSQLQTYALIFGQAGLLQESLPDDAYYTQLQQEYAYLKQKYQLTPVNPTCWNLLRLRPQNFPCLRLAQFSELFFSHPSIIQDIMNNNTHLDYLRTLFYCSPHPYWEMHFHFGKLSPQKHTVSIGKRTINLLFINAIIPIMHAYSHFWGDELLQVRAMNLYESIPFEENHITKRYREAGFPDYNALFSQAILELQQYYCTHRRCAECGVGCWILGKYKKNSTFATDLNTLDP